ncbi:hypothetical protein G6F40_014017 [Rhizopus arrhizus]|nr:hypothetical protein G6F40_014017 [Rhizopus arrhizus]
MTLPRARFTIVPVPPDIAPFWTAGRGGMGTYWLNTYNLPSRPLYNLPALTLHESDPGHALQGAIAAEQKNLPEFRRNAYISAYGEGWALYCEKLGVEMGIYETPYEDFGRLTYEMWRAARLVIDTGVHSKGWTREQALAYLRDQQRPQWQRLLGSLDLLVHNLRSIERRLLDAERSEASLDNVDTRLRDSNPHTLREMGVRLRQQLTPGSVLFRHGLRMALALIAGFAAIRLFNAQNG